MALTVPLGRQARLSVGHSREAGWWAARWLKPRASDFVLPDEDPPPAGVREPRIPPPSSLGGAAAVSEPD